MNERNHWITFVNDFVVRWGAFLPAPRGDIGALVRFGVGVVEAGARHAVYHATRLPAARPYEAGQGSFEAYLRAEAQRSGRVPLFPSDTRPGPELWTPARLAFYRGDSIVEEEVGDVGALLCSLRPDRIETCRMFMRSAASVAVLGKQVSVDHAEEVRVEVRLDTDIWFPRVMGMLEELPEEDDPPSMYDNRALAERHTPRLNAFVGELRRLTLDLGGRWETLETDSVAVNYAAMWNEEGIFL
ncbi:MAG TPA: hypothetical protein VM580_29065 [Labilithrix sp.]|nr:hypothetical protein [Labilithrix sp.]